MPTVHVSIAVTAGYRLAERCLETLFATTRHAPFSLRVTVTDNAPGQGIGRRLTARFPQVELIENAVRRGYAANHNAALRASDADYLVVANDDLEFIAGGLARVIAVLEQPAHADVAAAGMKLLNPDGTLQPSTYRFPGVSRILLDLSGLRARIGFSRLTRALARLAGRGDGRSRFWAHDRTIAVDTYRGAIDVVRAASVRAVGWMTETTLLGGEETDWHRRMWNAGWRVLFVHDAPIVHHGSQTLRLAPELHAEFLKGAIAFTRRHRPWPVYALLRILLVPTLLARWILAPRRAAPLLRVAWSWKVP